MCITLVIMYIFSSLSTLIQNRLMVSIAQNTSAKIRKNLFESIQKLPVSYYDTHSSGDLMSRLTNDVDNINNTLSQSIIQFASGIINIAGNYKYSRYDNSYAVIKSNFNFYWINKHSSYVFNN